MQHSNYTEAVLLHVNNIVCFMLIMISCNTTVIISLMCRSSVNTPLNLESDKFDRKAKHPHRDAKTSQVIMSVTNRYNLRPCRITNGQLSVSSKPTP